jgi:hypothetical protein
MRCLVCAAEMYVTQVVEDGTMPVPGFEHHTMECFECGAMERRRLVFTREKTQPISPSDRRNKERIVKPRTPMEAFECDPCSREGSRHSSESSSRDCRRNSGDISSKVGKPRERLRETLRARGARKSYAECDPERV